MFVRNEIIPADIQYSLVRFNNISSFPLLWVAATRQVAPNLPEINNEEEEVYTRTQTWQPT